MASARDDVSALSLDARSHDDNMSGYSGQREDGASSYSAYYNRLTKFYMKYNPEKLSRVDEFLKAYRGEEEQLFALLAEKYGPEPDPPRLGSVCSTSDVGVRARVPRSVPKEVGFTQEDSPYWPGSKTVSDRDLCELLESSTTTNTDLKSTFVGVLSAHPASASNGLTYISSAPVPSDGTRFLGHHWTGSLANNKILVHKGIQYHRTVLHCTDQCSNAEFTHDRWRLTMYRAEHTPNVLFRCVWDPLIEVEPAGFEEKPKHGSFQVQYTSRKRPEPVVAEPQQHASPAATYQQPQQPMALGPVDIILGHLHQFEARLNARLQSLEDRVMNIETALLDPEQPM